MLNSFSIMDLGKYITKKLNETNNKINNVLTITVSNEEFHKIDEDLYYRQNPNGTSYIPSVDEIAINFDNVTIKIVSV